MHSLPVPRGEVDPAHTAEPTPTPEALRASPRIVIYGRKFHDGPVLARAMAEELAERGIHNVGVDAVYDTADLKDAFFGRGGWGDTSTGQVALSVGSLALPQQDAPETSRQLPATGGSRGAEAPAEDTKPIGVIVFPEMRQYDSMTGMGMSVSGHVEYIEDLCEQHGVPLVHASLNAEESGSLGDQLVALIPTPGELPAVEQS